MQFAPDGRLFVCEQGGRLRVIKDGVLLPTPFTTISTDSSGERGLLGVAFDPAFLTTPYVYVYYTAYTPTVHNRISRFTANGDVAVPGSEVVILELDRLYASNHNGGALAFGPDGKLYAAVGGNGVGSDAQLMTNLMGKMLRLNKDGSIPADNPFYIDDRQPGTGRSGVRPAQPVHVRVQRRRDDVHQRRRAEHLGGNQRRHRRRQLRLADDRRGHLRSRRFEVPICVQSLQRGVRNYRWGLLLSANGTVSIRLFGRLLLRRLLWRLDSRAGCGAGTSGTPEIPETFATRISRLPSISRCPTTARSTISLGEQGGHRVVRRIQYGHAPLTGHHHSPVGHTVQPGAPGDVQRERVRPPALRYQWQRNGVNVSGATAEDYPIAGCPGGQRRAVPRAG